MSDISSTLSLDSPNLTKIELSSMYAPSSLSKVFCLEKAYTLPLA